MGWSLQEAFEDIKKYLTKPPVLVDSVKRKSFLLYARTMDHSLGILLAQKNDEGWDLRRTLIGTESLYNPVEKECLALIFVVQRIRHYLVGQTIHVVSRVNLLRIFMTKRGSLNSRLANGAILLSQYDMTFVPQKVVKGQALADFLAAHPVSKTSKLHTDISDEVSEANVTLENDVWQMFFDSTSRTGPTRKIIARGGVVFVSPENHVLSRAFSLTESCSNNIAEYNALLIVLQVARQIGVR